MPKNAYLIFGWKIDNLKKAARLIPGEHIGTPFYDGPIYKTLEGAVYTLISNPNADLDRYVENLISIIRAAQEPNGYIYTARTIDPKKMPPLQVRSAGRICGWLCNIKPMPACPPALERALSALRKRSEMRVAPNTLNIFLCACDDSC